MRAEAASISSADVTVADAGASPLPDSTTVVGGTTYQPADYDVAEVGAMFGSPLVALNHATTNGTATFASAFNTIDPNGIWTLYAADDTVGGTGSITSWSLDFAVGGAVDRRRDRGRRHACHQCDRLRTAAAMCSTAVRPST